MLFWRLSYSSLWLLSTWMDWFWSVLKSVSQDQSSTGSISFCLVARSKYSEEILSWLHTPSAKGSPREQSWARSCLQSSCMIFFEALDGLGIKFLLYADIFIYCFDVSLSAFRGRLLEALWMIAQWCHYWKLIIRPNKCHAINLSQRQEVCGFDFCISSGLIAWTDELKFLLA